MTKYNTIPNDDEALLAAKKQKSFKGLVAGAAIVSFVLGMVAAAAVSPAAPNPTMGAIMQTTSPTTKTVQLNTKGGKTSSGDQYWWQEGATSWRTVSPLLEGLGLNDLKKLVDQLDDNGVKALTLMTAFDSGADNYEACEMWCGLATSDHMKVNPMIGSDKDFKELADYVHKKDMKLMSWLNPSYFDRLATKSAPDMTRPPAPGSSSPSPSLPQH